MSDTHAVGSVPVPHAAKTQGKGTSKVLIAALVLVLALVAFAYVMFFAGGLDVAEALIASLSGRGASGSGQPPVQGRSTSTPAAVSQAASSSASAESTHPTIPALFKRQMFYEQIASQATIGELLANKFGAFDIGQVAQQGPRQARIRLTARYRTGSSFSGTMVLRRIDKGWFFFSIVRDGNAQRLPSSPTFDDVLVDTIVDQQYEYQKTIAGLLNGGYKRMSIAGVRAGSGTKTISYTLSGGTLPARRAEAVALLKSIDGKQYWFISAIK